MTVFHLYGSRFFHSSSLFEIFSFMALFLASNLSTTALKSNNNNKKI